MAFSYTPRRLKMAREDIALVHPQKGEPPKLILGDDLRKLILALVSLEQYQIKGRAYALTDRETYMVAGYIPHNYYNVEMKNLFQIFSIRTSDKLCEILFNQWQESYQNGACNAFIRDALANDEHLSFVIQKKHMIKSVFDSILQDSDIAVRFGKELGNLPLAKSTSFADKMAYLGIRDDSRLFKDCKFLFYTYCERQDYLAIQKTELVDLAKQYYKRSKDTLASFLKNFLLKLELKDLIDFKNLADYLRTITGDDYSTVKFERFFRGFKHKLIRKYINWINFYKVEEYFGNDERSRFWKQYRFESVRRYNYSNAVVMEFEKYFAVEFLGAAMGPIYIYSKEYFEQYIMSKFSYYDNQQMRQMLYQGGDGQWFYRKPHLGYWQSDVHSTLVRNRITERLDI